MELKECPFCGSKAERKTNRKNGSGYSAIVGCVRQLCPAKIEQATLVGTAEDAYNYAEDAWNERKSIDPNQQYLIGRIQQLEKANGQLLEERNGYKLLSEESDVAYLGLIELIRTLPDKILQLDSFADSEEYGFPSFQCSRHTHDDELDEWFGTFTVGLSDHVNGVVDDLLSDLLAQSAPDSTEPHSEVEAV